LYLIASNSFRVQANQMYMTTTDVQIGKLKGMTIQDEISAKTIEINNRKLQRLQVCSALRLPGAADLLSRTSHCVGWLLAGWLYLLHSDKFDVIAGRRDVCKP